MPLFNPPIAPWVISNDIGALAGVATTVLTANNVYLYAFEVGAGITVSSGKWRMGTTATGTTDIGVYDASGNLLGHTGASANTASTNMVANFISSLALAPGQYFLALCPSNSTDTYMAIAGTASQTATTRNRAATNTGTAGVLPGTTGGYSDSPSKVPACALGLLNQLA